MMRTLVPILVAVVLAFLLGIAAMNIFARTQVQRTEDDSTVLVEQIRKVSKLVTVEGDVYELFNRKQTRDVTFYLPLPATMSFDKQASVQVTGKVLVGYDLAQMDVTVDDATKTITLANLPEPEILAIDHQVVYKNLDESWFNSFTARDYSELNKAAKDRLRAKALESDLLDRARAEGNAVLETIGFLAAGAGYELVLSLPTGSRTLGDF